ncbi:M23 family metallopeptidase [Alsobacter sp. R-9]
MTRDDAPSALLCPLPFAGPRNAMAGLGLGLMLLLTPAIALAQSPAPPVPFVLPIDCRIGTSCFVQNYVDADPGEGAKDFTCGTRTYDKHNGTDIRVLSMADQKRGVAVLAAAPGKVRAIRDEEPDISVRERTLAAVAGRECGNGLVIDHGGGWTTQYCHMARGSIAVKPGDTVGAGDRLGLVGLSGNTEYPHLHFTVRRGDTVVDPFALDAAPGTCGTGGQRVAWSPAVAQALAYAPRAVLNTGFAAGPVDMPAIEAGAAGATPPSRDSEALVAFARAIGLKQGDVQRMTITGPDGRQVVQSALKPLPRDQAQSMIFAGRKRPPSGFPAGEYTALYEVLRDQKPVLSHTFTVRIDG